MKILYFLSVILCAYSNAAAETMSGSSDVTGLAHDCTEAFLRHIGDESLNVQNHNGTITLRGSRAVLDRVINILVTPACLSQYFPFTTPVCPDPREGQVTSLLDFLIRLGISMQEFQCFNQYLVSHFSGPRRG
jgi:hypothetical protein